jgi:AcrR family transcriptional regulator
MGPKNSQQTDRLTETCLAAFTAAGSLDLSLDQLATRVGISKRMLLHYFGSRENLEERAVALLEDRLRARFAPGHFPAGAALETVVTALWEQSATSQSRGILLLIMDVSRRAWSGSDRARAFYREQQRLWIEMLAPFLPHPPAVEELLQLFQGAILTFLVSGDSDLGKRALIRMVRRCQNLDESAP